MSSKKKIESLSFEDSLQQLEQLVSEMEAGDLPLERALEQYERGIQLIQHGQDKLQKAEQKVTVLQHKGDHASPVESLSSADPSSALQSKVGD
jgi:exodeoxyribonuclease VII small subunit